MTSSVEAARPSGFGGRRNRHTLRIATVLGAALAGLGIVVASFVTAGTQADAAAKQLEVSFDGVNFSPSNGLPIIKSEGELVPGESISETFWIRNTSKSAARLRIELIDPAATTPEIAEGLRFGVSINDRSIVDRVSVARGIANGSCTVLDNSAVLQAKATSKVHLSADLDRGLVGREGAGETVTFRLGGTLRDALVPGILAPGARCTENIIDPPGGGGRGGGGGGGSTGGLAITGASESYNVLIAGVVALAGGVTVLILAKRNRARTNGARH